MPLLFNAKTIKLNTYIINKLVNSMAKAGELHYLPDQRWAMKKVQREIHV